MTDTLAPPTVPFDAFLGLLRDKGFAIGLHEHMALGRLLERWDATNAEEFGHAIAALVARNEEEVRSIQGLFAETYVLASRRGVAAPPTEVPASAVHISRYSWMLAVAAALLLGFLAVRLTPERPATGPPEGQTGTAQPPSQPPGVPDDPIVPPEPPAPNVPPAPFVLKTLPASLIGAAAFLLTLSAFWALKVRDQREEWLRAAWASALAAIPGPYHFHFAIRAPVAKLPRTAVEDAANILGHAFGNVTVAANLDIVRTLRQTLRKGALTTFVFRRRRAAQPLLVLEDLSVDMRVWRSKVDLFVADLRRQGIPLDRFYFDGDARRTASAPHRATVALEWLLEHRPEAPVLILSDGAGLAATFEHSPETSAWYRALARRDRRSWLTPVSDDRLWPAEFGRLPCRVWPMTGWGLKNAARELAGDQTAVSDRIRAGALEDTRVSLDGLERMKRLASLVPYPSTDLLEFLRRQFAPDVSDAAVLYLVHEAGRAAAPVVRLHDDELARCLSAVRFETPRLEARARHALLDVLALSEPAKGSAAHARWQISIAIHRLALAHLGEGDVSEAAAILDALGRGPMWEEVRHIARLTPDATSLDRRPEDRSAAQRLRMERDGRAAPPTGTPPEPAGRMPWAWPGPREALPAAVVALALVGATWMAGALPLRALSHVPDAYRLSYSGGSAVGGVTASNPGLLRLERPADRAASVPSMVDLYRDGRRYRSGIDLRSGATSIALASADLGSHYQVRAALPEGNLALSPSVWVPGERVVVLIDALPWARVTIEGDKAPEGSQTTPFSAALEPGVYRLRFENGGLTPEMDQQITVATPGSSAAAAARTFRFTMPGFDANRTAASLANSP